ncbi:MAG TPA: hypothetical protein VLD60_07305 [Nitrospira sp.]|nr:hypothetical protein [Nitrospira sp.]
MTRQNVHKGRPIDKGQFSNSKALVIGCYQRYPHEAWGKKVRD